MFLSITLSRTLAVASGSAGLCSCAARAFARPDKDCERFDCFEEKPSGTDGMAAPEPVPVPLDVAHALWQRTLDETAATELASEDERRRLASCGERVWADVLLPPCLASGVVVVPAENEPPAPPPAPQRDPEEEQEEREREKQQRAEERAAEQRLAEANARLAERRRLVELCHRLVVPALQEKLDCEALERCDTGLRLDSLNAAALESSTDSADAQAQVRQEEAELVDLAKARIAEAISQVESVANEMEQVHQRVERVLSFAFSSPPRPQAAAAAANTRERWP